MAFNIESIIYPTDSNFMRPFETCNTVLALGMIYYLLKDIYQGRSLGKRALRIAVKDTVSLNWTASTDNVGVTGYLIYQNGVQVGTSATTSYTDTGLTAGTSYAYTVKAEGISQPRATAFQLQFKRHKWLEVYKITILKAVI